ncbi:MAG TPA: DUF4339 domain-containing protein [Luteibacter sp.]|jgi:hypothetical protein|uniref:DUF4339 domain-containing protein n=1 Tax=Luteibacter sp. TaxID=1886636 RepID=UPI002F3E3D9C
MVNENKIWVGRNGERFGPYDEATLRAWITEGKVEATAMGWREGMADWQPLHVILGIVVPPPMTGAPPMGMPAGVLHNELPPPPDLHWGILFVVDLFAGGLLGLVWQFFQASWVKKIDPSSRATLWLVISLCLLPVTWFLMMGMVLNQSTSERPDIGAIAGAMSYFSIAFLLGLAAVVIRYVAYFSMARSMREKLPAYGLVPEISGVTLFFFTHYYLQGQMSWVARWRTTGQVTPPAPKGVFWILLAAWFGFVLLLLLLFSLVMFGTMHH